MKQYILNDIAWATAVIAAEQEDILDSVRATNPDMDWKIDHSINGSIIVTCKNAPQNKYLMGIVWKEIEATESLCLL